MLQQIQKELDKLKKEMLKKIEDIHDLELELVKIEGCNSSSKSHQQINNLASRNEEVMNEIRNMLKETTGNNEPPPVTRVTVTKILREYTKSTKIIDEKHSNDSTNSEYKQILIPDQSDYYKATNLNIHQRFQLLNENIEKEFGFLKSRIEQLEDKVKQGEKVSYYEVECVKSLTRGAREKYEMEKIFLFKEFSDEDGLKTRILSELDRVLGEKHSEMQTMIRRLYSILPSNLQDSNTNLSESSFLTEEEDAIKKISEKIRLLKAKIDSKEKVKKKKKRANNRNEQMSSSSEDTDAKELINLNDQIKVLKERMISKGDELNKRKINTNQAFYYDNLQNDDNSG